MRRLLADTDVVSYIFKWHPSAPRFVELLADNEVVLSFVTPAEMRLGALKAHWGFRKRNLLERYLSRFAVCCLTSSTTASKLRVILALAQHPIQPHRQTTGDSHLGYPACPAKLQA